MSPFPQGFQFLVVALAGWINQQQRDAIDYLQEENRVLREQLAPHRLRSTDAQRRRLAAKAKALGRQALRDLETLVTPDTLLRWHRHLIATKYDGSRCRGPGRPRTMAEIRQLIVRMATENRAWDTRIRGALDNRQPTDSSPADRIPVPGPRPMPSAPWGYAELLLSVSSVIRDRLHVHDRVFGHYGVVGTLPPGVR